jgi:hypothetical protein
MALAAVSAMAAYFALSDDRLSDTQMNIAAVAAKRHETSLYPNDPILGHEGRWRFNTPAFQVPMEMILVPTDYEDLTLPFRTMAGVLTMVFLCGMYALLYRQTRSWSVSAYVAVLGSTVTHTLARSYWGVGSLASVTPQGVVTALLPLIMLAYLHYENTWRVLLVFAAVGLLGNVHIVSAGNLTIILLIVYLVRMRFSPAAWPMAIACLLCAGAAAIPYAGYYWHLRVAAAPAGAEIDAAEVYQAFRLGGLAVLYPGMLKDLLYWLALVAVLLVPAVAVLSRVERFRVRDLSAWVAFGCGALFVALGLHGAGQIAGILRGDPPPVIDFARAASLVMLPLYVLFAQALTNLFRLMRAHKVRMRWACAAFMVAWMLPSDNLRVGRHMAYDLIAAGLPNDRTPLRVMELRDKKERHDELAAIAAWARAESDQAAVFLVDTPEFRALSRRSVAACKDDVNYFYYVTPWELGDWRRKVVRQGEVLSPPGKKASDQEILAFIDDLAAQASAPVPEWYVVLRAADAPDAPGGLTLVSGTGWGKHYVLYRAG